MKLLIFLLFFSFKTLACEVTLPVNMLVMSESQLAINGLKAIDCTDSEMNALTGTISSLDGRVASFQLEEILKSKGHTIFVSPRSFLVQQVKTLIREQLSLPEGTQVAAVTAGNSQGVIELAAGDKISIDCTSCLYGASQPMSIIVQGFDGTSKSHFIKADFKRMVRAYRVVLAIPSFSNISPRQMLVEQFVESIPHTDLITDLGSLKFYKTNKPIKAGELLRLADLNAVNLVKAGLKTEVILENSMVRIKTQGISRSNGAIGEFVEVFHPQKNQKYQGKVIDINKVLVEL